MGSYERNAVPLSNNQTSLRNLPCLMRGLRKKICQDPSRTNPRIMQSPAEVEMHEAEHGQTTSRFALESGSICPGRVGAACEAQR